eukprot:TRINITY_DN1321_c0_g1_i1.p1 TRINITY_DN1321_c0_g1~~TRINITY_DN1321_c0_g1_i1.p1  ORF type:complete len:103 (+),score=19.89 TRINITY_DN1321_c0_g1_i1:253-561(+)
MAALEEKFAEASEWVKKSRPATKIPDERQLLGYKFFKQATEGDVQGSQPWAVQMVARAKWDAWDSVKGMSKEQAMQEYIDECLRQKEEFGVTDPEGVLDFTA